MPATAHPQNETLTPAQRAGFQRLVERGLLRQMPEPRHVELPVLPELASVDTAHLLDELRDDR